MDSIQDISKELFYESIPEKRKNYFLADVHKYEIMNALKGFYVDDVLVGGIRLGINSDSFDEVGMDIIHDLLNSGYNKLSYFYVRNKYQGHGYGKRFLQSIISKENKCYLTCTGDKLLKYYKHLGFENVHTCKNTYIMTYNK